MKRVWAFLLFLPPVPAQTQYEPKQPLAPETVLLARIRAVASENARRIPDFTCGMTVERSVRRARSGRFEPSDTLRLEVAFSGGKELYAWPGAKRFDASDISDVVGTGGAIGTGDFAAHVQSVLLSDSPSYRYIGREPLNGHETHRFDYHVLRERSKYFMRIPPVEENVAYHGSFWVDQISMDIVRLVVNVTEPPPTLPLRSSRKVIDLERQKIGETEFLLPLASEVEMELKDGAASLNRTRFQNCHQFRGESSLTFEDPPPEAAPLPASILTTLPAGLKLNLDLAQPLDLKTAARGDQVFLVTTREAKSKDGFTVPKGATFTGRVDMLECIDSSLPLCFLMLHLESFRYANKEGTVRALLEAPVWEIPGAANSITSRRTGRMLVPEELVKHPEDRGVLSIRGGRQTLKPGYTTVWRVLPPR
jgi:hypothetical protein